MPKTAKNCTVVLKHLFCNNLQRKKLQFSGNFRLFADDFCRKMFSLAINLHSSIMDMIG